MLTVAHAKGRIIGAPESGEAPHHIVFTRPVRAVDVLGTGRDGVAEGLLGFPEAREFVLVPAEREGFFWLQSLDFGALAFLLVDPFPFVDEFFVDLAESEVGVLEPDDGSEMAVLAIITLPRQEGDTPTVNLQGPLVFNMKRGLGRQLVLQESRWGVRWSLSVPDEQPAA